jgi:hypothetical protein
MGKMWLLPILIIAAALIGVALLSMLNEKKENTNSESSSTSVVSGFLPATLCKNTGGSWEEVLSSEYPVNESEGVYNPTTNSAIAYKCFCPENKIWSKEGGCT